jgi:hypothetical protein
METPLSTFCTPAAMVNMSVKFRPRAGSSPSDSSLSVEMAAFCRTSMMGDSAVTCTVSASFATSSVRSMRNSAPSLTTMPGILTGVNPDSVAVSS